MSKLMMTLLLTLFALIVVTAVAFGLSKVTRPPETTGSSSPVVLGEPAKVQTSDGGGVQPGGALPEVEWKT